jgi:hypothetical protein
MEDLKTQLDTLKKDFEKLKEDFYRNNFSSQQDFNKKVSFNTGLKVPHYDMLPTSGEVGEIIEVGGRLYICQSANTFNLV